MSLLRKAASHSLKPPVLSFWSSVDSNSLINVGTSSSAAVRRYATVTSANKPHHKVLIVGGGSAGIGTAAQLRRHGGANWLQANDIAIIDPASDHHYQPGWTLVGSGLSPLSAMSRPMSYVIPDGVNHYPLHVNAFNPSNNSLSTKEGLDFTYDYLIVAPGLKTDFSAVSGLENALADPSTGVSSIYSHKTVEQVWRNIQDFRSGEAIFTQPAGVIKCAGAPQKILWMALSQWTKDNKRDAAKATFATGMPSMFAVPKYSKALEELRKERNVEGLFQHNLVAVDAQNKTATFKNLAKGGEEVKRDFKFLHVVPPQKPHEWVAKSELADPASGWVQVDQKSTQHVKYPNVFSIGDASSLPNSKTAAAVTSQIPVLIDNLLAVQEGKKPQGVYTGYASCPLLTGHNELLLAEFKYGGIPEETFASYLGSQDVPRRAFYHLKKDIFPAVYFNSHLKGTWFGRHGFVRPNTAVEAA